MGECKTLLPAPMAMQPCVQADARGKARASALRVISPSRMVFADERVDEVERCGPLARQA